MNKVIKLICLFVLFVFLSKAQDNKLSADTLLAFAKKHIGIKYKYASINPKEGFDCSGFVYYVFGHFNIKVPRASMDYENAGKIIPVDLCKAGDIIVFTGTNAKNRVPGHVGIIVSNSGNEIKFIHSSSGNKGIGVIITDFKASPSYQIRFIKVVRLSVLN